MSDNIQPAFCQTPCCTLPLVQLWNEDCRKTLERIETGSVNLMLTDIPYGATGCDWDTKPNIELMWLEWERILKPNGAWIFTATQPLTSELVISRKDWFKYELIWNKKMVSSPALAKIQPLRSHENILVFYKSQPTYNPIMRSDVLSPFGKLSGTKSDVTGSLGTEYQTGVGYPKSILEFPRPNNLTDGGLHPSQKPIDLFRWLIQTYTNEGDTVFDGYSGSGTTAAACLKEKRRFIGSELSKEYFDLSVNRLTEMSMQTELF